jgi:5-(carboxyamino)imidazole ribonucleotide synthase
MNPSATDFVQNIGNAVQNVQNVQTAGILMTAPLPTGSTIGILGGGQLGRMLSVAASRLGFKTAIFEPGGDCPASHVANFHLQAGYDDIKALEKFGNSVDVLTYEFENIPTEALDALDQIRPIRPGREALRISQDRLTEKTFLRDLGLQTAPFATVDDAASLAQAIETIGTPSILKTRRFGYDGKGQARLTKPEDAAEALAALQGAPAVLEGFVDFTCEISVIAARGTDGRVAAFDPGENVHEGGILRTTTVPASLPNRVLTDAVLTAGKILNALDYIGVLGVEFFVTPGGLIVNEIAPRVHNSGHWTQNGCMTDQFEQHIRAVAGWPLGDGSRHSDIRMENLIGDDMDRVPALAADPACALHLYGKTETKPGRKMGHANFLVPKD